MMEEEKDDSVRNFFNFFKPDFEKNDILIIGHSKYGVEKIIWKFDKRVHVIEQGFKKIYNVFTPIEGNKIMMRGTVLEFTQPTVNPADRMPIFVLE